MNRISRRFIALVLAITAALMLALPALVQAQKAGPIKIGVLIIDGGPFATYASLVEESARASVDILNAEGGALGRKFEVVTQAHAGTPASAIAATNKLVLQGRVSFLTGQTPTSHSLAISPKFSDLNAIEIDVLSAGAKTWNVISPNYAVGHTFSKKFTETDQDLGGTVQHTLYAPVGMTDFGSCISQLGASRPMR